MSITTFEAVIENGQIRIPPDFQLPEGQAVFVVVPGFESPEVAQFPSVQLANPEDAKHFEMKVSWSHDT